MTQRSNATESRPVNKPVMVSLLLIHALAIPMGYFFFSYAGLISLAVMYLATGLLGVTLYLHRLKTHRSFEAHWLVEYFCGLCATWSLQGTILEWVSTHLKHHDHSDQEGDPHSPQHGFWHSHIFWMWLYETPQEKKEKYLGYGRRLFKDRFVLAMSSFTMYILANVFLGLLLFFTGFFVGMQESLLNGLFMGMSILTYGMLVRVVVVWHGTWCINSVCHVLGYRNYDTEDHSRNNVLFAVIDNGEGYHNNHHGSALSANHGLHRWHELFDSTFYVILFLGCVGWVFKCIGLKRFRPVWNIRFTPPSLRKRLQYVKPVTLFP